MPGACATLVLGARGSRLAQAQMREVTERLRQARPGLGVAQRSVRTTGDRIRHVPLPEIGQKGLFTLELEQALRRGDIDAAVHSYKDLALEQDDDLPIVAVLPRAYCADVLVAVGGDSARQDDKRGPLSAIPRGGCVGTSSVRRKALLLHARPDLRVIDVRGNMDTRLARLRDPSGPYDALVLAQAGLRRLLKTPHSPPERVAQTEQWVQRSLFHVLNPATWPPAPAQGALAIQCRAEQKWLELFAPLDHVPTRLETTAERALLQGLGGGCSLPIGAHARRRDGCLTLIAAVLAADGTKRVDARGQCVCPADSLESGERAARDLGEKLAEQALAMGGAALLQGL